MPIPTQLRVCFMPQLLPDELLYSFIGRIAAENLFGSPKSNLEALFGTKYIIPSIDLPSKLDSLQQRLGKASPWGSTQELINSATLYPYYRPFLTPEHRYIADSIIFSGGGKALKIFMGIVANRFGASHPLRSCTLCSSTDIRQFGAPYWHRAHQLPGVVTCYRHGCALNMHALRAPVNRQHLLLLPQDGVLIDVPAKTAHQQVSFAVLSHELLTAELPLADPQKLQAVYKDAIFHLGFNLKGHVHHQSLALAVRQYFYDFEGFVHRERLLSTVNNPLYWVRSLLERPGRTAHPICHLLLIKFLFNTIAAYRQAIIAADSKVPIKNVEPRIPNARYQNLTLTPLEIAKLRDESCSCRDVARAISMSLTSVIKYRQLMEVPIARRPKKWNTEALAQIISALHHGRTSKQIIADFKVSQSTISRLKAQLPEFEVKERGKKVECLAKKRNQWLEQVKHYQKEGTQVARASAPAIYAWLYRNDREWLNQTSSRFDFHRPVRTYINWAERDLQLCDGLRNYIDENKHRNPRCRVSKTFMAKYIGEAFLKANKNKLPKLQLLISNLEETLLEYQFYKIDRAIIKLNINANVVAHWRIQRFAGIKKWNKFHEIYTRNKVVKIKSIYEEENH